jgi:hypothetical protein
MQAGLARGSDMKSLEPLLINLDEWPWSAVGRVVLGLLIPPVFHAVAGGHDSITAYLVMFVGLLAALRVVPALFRFTLPFSADAKQVWRARRQIAKESDAYQWQKLFSIGLGLLIHGSAVEGLGNAGLALMAFCLLGGGAGLLLWQKARTGLIA